MNSLTWLCLTIKSFAWLGMGNSFAWLGLGNSLAWLGLGNSLAWLGLGNSLAWLGLGNSLAWLGLGEFTRLVVCCYPRCSPLSPHFVCPYATISYFRQKTNNR